MVGRLVCRKGMTPDVVDVADVSGFWERYSMMWEG